VFVADSVPTGATTITSLDRNYVAPLYLYHGDVRTANFDGKTLIEFTRNLNNTPPPIEILDYIYAVLHSPNYREKYNEFLKNDFPRIPAPQNEVEFMRLVGLGSKLRQLHLMQSPIIDRIDTEYPMQGSNRVERCVYTDKKIWINEQQYFGKVPKSAWEFYVGGYQPAQKWLKDRKERDLTNIEILHYQKIIKILVETAKLTQLIDEAWGI